MVVRYGCNGDREPQFPGIIRINGKPVEAEEGAALLGAADAAGIYIPRLCSHPALSRGKGYGATASRIYRGGEAHDGGEGVYEGCGLCLVKVGDAVRHACEVTAAPGMTVITDDGELQRLRQANLARILAAHPHSCLLCAQREGCSRTQCSSNVPVEERCCPKLGNCELQKVAEYIGIPKDIPRYVPGNLPGEDKGPLFARDYNLCVGCLRCVRACGDLRGVGALAVTFRDGRPLVGWSGATPEESNCRYCGACAEVCPTGAVMDIVERPAGRAPCVAACPLGMDIPAYVRAVAEGRSDEAARIVREYTPLPRTLARVCFHPCEESCRRGSLGGPLAICAVKRFAMETEHDNPKSKIQNPKSSTGKRVAVVGAGPAGLAAAFHLALNGHWVTLFDEGSEPGGMLASGIPGYRLPADVLRKDIEELLSAGIEFRGGTKVGRDIPLDALPGSGYDAVFLAVGCPVSKRIPLGGPRHPDVRLGIEFLREVNSSRRPDLGGKQLLVVGGGNVAVDVALSALRCGAGRVEVACLENREEMPAFKWEVQRAESEGITIHNSWGPERAVADVDGAVRGVEFVRCTSVFDPGTGRFNPKFDRTARRRFDADTVILAIGQSADLGFLTGECGVEKTPQGLIRADRDSPRTARRGFYAGGDAVHGPASVVRALASGRRAAEEIDVYLGGDGAVAPPAGPRTARSGRIGRVEGFASLRRREMPVLAAGDAAGLFAEIERGYGESDARAEAARCLQCDLRHAIPPQVMPPEPWIEATPGNIRRIPEGPGVFHLYDAAKGVLLICGCMNLREALEREAAARPEARYFSWEEAQMYSQRESELLSHHLQRHGKLPPGNDELSELF